MAANGFGGGRNGSARVITVDGRTIDPKARIEVPVGGVIEGSQRRWWGRLRRATDDRRTHVVRIFPDTASCLRLVREAADEGSVVLTAVRSLSAGSAGGLRPALGTPRRCEDG